MTGICGATKSKIIALDSMKNTLNDTKVVENKAFLLAAHWSSCSSCYDVIRVMQLVIYLKFFVPLLCYWLCVAVFDGLRGLIDWF